MFPVTFIYNNLVWNKDNECYAYYELMPFGYNFLSYDEKLELREAFTQLISQIKTGQIHLMQIATEQGIRNTQNKCKEHILGQFKEFTENMLDEQTEVLISQLGENQLDYRFFIGVKLIASPEELSFKSLSELVKINLQAFINDLNIKAMGDYATMPKSEISRFSRLEKNVDKQLSRRFKMRKINKNDYGYLLEHLYGQSLTAFEDYDFSLNSETDEKETKVKSMDLIRPARTMITEGQRYLQLDTADKTIYATYLTINNIVSELDFPSSEIFYYGQQQFDFPIDTSIHIEVLENKKALSSIRKKKMELEDMENHAYQSNVNISLNVDEALDDINELEASLNKNKEGMYKISFVIRVTADNLTELKDRRQEVIDFYDDLNIKIVCPFGDMLGLHSEFIPASKRYMNDYIQYVTSDFLGSLGFGATTIIGEKNGIYIGYDLDTDRNVYIQPWLAAQGVSGSVTNSLSAAFLGSLGFGKSLSNNLLTYLSVLYGAKALIIDPKSERGYWKETLPEIAEEINIVTLSNDIENQGMLDPFVIMSDIADSESLAIDILTFLTGISSRDGEKFPVLREAVKNVASKEQRGLLFVIDELRKMDTDVSINIARHIESFTDYDFARLLFSNGKVHNSISLNKQLNIIQIADLLLPDKNVTVENYTIKEMLSVAMLITVSTFALEFIKQDKSVFKIVNQDEAWAVLNVQQGRALAEKLIRAGRAMNAGVWFSTQNAVDVNDKTINSNIGQRFVFHSSDIDEIKSALSFLGLNLENEENQQSIRNLEIGQCLYSDIYGRVSRIQIHPVFERIIKAFDTKPKLKGSEKGSEE